MLIPTHKKFGIKVIAGLLSVSVLASCDYTTGTSRAHVPTLSLETPLHHRGNDPADHVVVVDTATVADIEKLYSNFDKEISPVLAAKISPPVVLPNDVPADFKQVKDVETRKEMFFGFALLPIHAVNETLLQERRFLLSLKEKQAASKPLNSEDEKHLLDLADRFGGEADIDSLLLRVDIVPMSLAMAQAAVESGWGTSRFAVEGNALFGEHTTSKDLGLAAEGMAKESAIHVEAFDNVYDSVASYMMNLNSHAAYAGFRKMRAEMREHGVALSGKKLATALTSYSERGAQYTRDLQAIISQNQLGVLDGTGSRLFANVS